MTRRPPAAVLRGRLGGRVGTLCALFLLSTSQAGGQEAARSTDVPPPAAREANPYLAFLPFDAEPRWPYWRQQLRRRAAERRQRLAGERADVVLAESEAPGTRGENDHPNLAEPLPGFGSATFHDSRATITGSLFPPAVVLASGLEPDGSIPQARSLVLPEGIRHTLDATLGDGAHGSTASGRGDFDFYAVVTDDGYRWLSITASAAPSTPDFDPIVAVYDATGGLLAYEEGTIEGGFLVDLDVSFDLLLERPGPYFVAVGGWLETGFSVPRDPFDSASGPGAGSEGDYALTVGLALDEARDADFFALPLRAGDVLGAALTGGDAELRLVEPSGELAVATRGDLSGLYSEASPLPGGGDAALAHVAAETGIYRLGVVRPSGRHPGEYRIDVLALRPRLDGALARRQKLFIDFDGAVVDRAWFSTGPPDPVSLSPLTSYLPRFGLEGREDELIDAILGTVREKLQSDVRLRGGNGDYSTTGRAGDFDIELLSSRDDPDPDDPSTGGDPDTARLVVGGSTEELRLDTIGIAQAVDVGSFDGALTGVVLLDLLSDPDGGGSSLHRLEVAEGTDRLAMVADVLGKIVAHEAGHLFGNFHTQRDGDLDTIMDSGGRIERLAGVGDDEIWDTPDDFEVDLDADRYEPREGFNGIERTLEVVSFDLPVGGGRAELVVAPARVQFSTLPVGQQEMRTLLLGNAGSTPLALDSTTIRPAPSPFALTSSLPPSLAAGATASVHISFLPTASAASEAELELVTDLPDPSVSVPLFGSGGLPSAALDPTGFDFGSIEYDSGDSTASVDLELSNSGTGPLLIRDVLFTGAHPERFEVSLDDSPLPAGATRIATVTFHPRGAVRDSSALLQVTTNDPLSPRLDVSLSGRAEGPDAFLDPPPPSFYLGAPELGEQRSRRFALQNRGTRSLHTTAIRLIDDASGQFSLDAPTLPASIAPYEAITVEVYFRAVEAGLATATLETLSDDPDTPSLQITLFAIGTRAVLTVSPSEIDFGSVAPGIGARRELTLGNEGDTTMFGTLTLTGDPEFELLGSQSFGLLAGGEFQIPVRFRPDTATHVAFAELVITSNDPETPTLTVPLRGSGSFGIPSSSKLGSSILIVLLMISAALALGRGRGAP